MTVEEMFDHQKKLRDFRSAEGYYGDKRVSITRYYDGLLGWVVSVSIDLDGTRLTRKGNVLPFKWFAERKFRQLMKKYGLKEYHSSEGKAKNASSREEQK